ncbi:MAG: 3'-5' exonuclease [Candidatus Dactylopiibacterium sp.]|nr:3'-5' exonuclease [Candidatus Dactylopiibacterium sp.]
MTLWHRLHREFARRRLRDASCAYLFAPPPANEWVSLDCETSSLNPRSAEIISIAAIRVHDHRIASASALRLKIRPQRPLAVDSIPIHLLREQDLADGLPLDEALEQLLRFVGSRPLLGYYLEFDLALLNRDLRGRLGVRLPNAAIDVSGLYYDRQVSAYRPEVDLSLSTILAELNLPDLPRHDPFNDALLAAMIFLKLRGNRA